MKPPDDPFLAYEPSDEQPFDDRRLSHLLRRTAFGLTPQRLSGWLGRKVSDVIDWLFNFDAEDDPFEKLVDGLEGFVNLNHPQSVASYWYYLMVNTPHPLQARV